MLGAWKRKRSPCQMHGEQLLQKYLWKEDPHSQEAPDPPADSHLGKLSRDVKNNPWHTMCLGTLFPVFPMNKRSLQQFASQNGQFNPWYGKHHLPSENLLPQNCGYQSMWESITWMPPSSPNWPWITGKTISTVIWRCLRNSGKDTKALAVLRACQNRR